MPIYIYEHPTSKKRIEVIQSVKDKHQYLDKDGVEWHRVFTTPQINTSGTLNSEMNSKQFSERTKNQKGNYGDLWDQSKELSEKRMKKYGYDPVKEKYKKDWSKKRKNKKFLE